MLGGPVPVSRVLSVRTTLFLVGVSWKWGTKPKPALARDREKNKSLNSLLLG